MMNGFIVVDKPAGMTSHDVVHAVRKITGIRKAGHTGTLDPFATGVLPVALGEGTKVIPFLDEGVKEYRGIIRLGVDTDSQDGTGTVVREREWRDVATDAVRSAAQTFLGSQLQVPPMFSAVKRNGVPLYRLARKGQDVEREARPIKIFAFDIDEVVLPDVTFRVRCSRGTYVRTLASDLGELLGCGAHLTVLRRTMSGPFRIEDALSLEVVSDLWQESRFGKELVTTHDALSHLRDISLSAEEAARVWRGIAPTRGDAAEPLLLGHPGERVRLSLDGILVAVAEADAVNKDDETARLKLIRVFNELSPLHTPTVVVKD